MRLLLLSFQETETATDYHGAGEIGLRFSIATGIISEISAFRRVKTEMRSNTAMKETHGIGTINA